MKIMKFTAVLLALIMLASCGAEPRQPNEPEVTKSTAAQELMSADDIMSIAIDHAKSSAEGAVAEALSDGIPTDRSTEFTAKNGIPIYDCKFRISQFMFEYEIDQQNGAIRTYSRGFDSDSETALGVVDENTALYYALWYLDIAEADISDASSIYDENFRDYYVKFSVGDDVYTCVIDPAIGLFLRSTRDVGYIGAEEIAYNHASQNVEESERDAFNNLMLAGEVAEKSTKANGVASERSYEVRFSVGGYDYVYVIEARTGNIISVNCDPADGWNGDRIGGFGEKSVLPLKPDIPDYFAMRENSASSGGYITEEQAADIAIADVEPMGLFMSNIDASLQSDANGRAYYDVSFYMGGEMYFYNIDAVSGNVFRVVRMDNDYSMIPDVDYDDTPADEGYIGGDAAVGIALEDASDGENESSNVFDIETELKYSHGSTVYEVSFIIADCKYEYDINAETGGILKAEKEVMTFILTDAE